MYRIYDALSACDLFVSIGTSGAVYPAAGFVAEARAAGAHTAELNLEPSEGASHFAEAVYGPATKSSRPTSIICCAASAQDARRPRCAAKRGTGQRARRA